MAVTTPAVGGRGINPGAWVLRSSVNEDDDPDDIPEDWGWPANSFSADQLRAHALETPPGEADPRAFQKGKWHVLPGSIGNGSVYVHNYTRDVIANEPANFVQLSRAEKKQLGVAVMDLPVHLRKIYNEQKRIPVVFGSADICHILTNYSDYAMDSQLLDTRKLRRMNSKTLEDCRRALVSAMKHGKALCIYIDDEICDFVEKVCVKKNRDTFPKEAFCHAGLEPESVKEQIYRPDDMESGQCVVREGFMVFVLIAYDKDLEMSQVRKDELQHKVPEFGTMHEVRCHCDDDKRKLLQRAQN